MEGEVSISEWDNNNKSLEFLQIRYTDVLGRFLARYLSMLDLCGDRYGPPIIVATE